MFGKNMKIGEGEKYDISQISKEGVTAEELAKIEQKNKKLIDIYKALGANENGLTKIDLAKAMDGFIKNADGDGDGKLSKKELKKYAEVFNDTYGVDVKGKDLKAFIKSVVNAGKGDNKADTAGVIEEHNQQEKLKADVDAAVDSVLNDLKAKETARQESEVKAKAEAEAKAKAEAEAKAADLKQPKNYTVQPNERLESILTRSLEAQGIEVNDENMAKAKEEFIKNNPKALHGPKGREYLYAGDTIKVPGNLEDKANADEITGSYRKQQDEIKAAEEEKARAAEEAKLKAAEEEKAKAAEKEKSSTPSFIIPEFEPGKTYAPPTDEEKKAAEIEKSRQAVTKRMAVMNKYPLMEQLPNGYSRRDAPGANDAYFDATGNRISKDMYNKARGKKSRLVDNMVKSPILEQLPNGYTKRDVPGAKDFYYDKDGNRITKEQYEKAKNA